MLCIKVSIVLLNSCIQNIIKESEAPSSWQAPVLRTASVYFLDPRDAALWLTFFLHFKKIISSFSMFTKTSLCPYSHYVYFVIKSEEWKIFHIALVSSRWVFQHQSYLTSCCLHSLIKPSCGILSQFLMLLIRCGNCEKIGWFFLYCCGYYWGS